MKTQHCILTAVCSILLSLSSRSQDPHFTQYFASPLTLNPALTGDFDGPFRITSNFRQQWWAVGDPFTTGSLSFEHRLMQGKLGENDRMAIAGMMMLDNSMSGGLKSTYFSISGGYHKGLAENHRLGAGFQATYGNRIVDYSKLTFYNQFSTDGFNTNLPSGEMALANLKSYVDLSAGLLYTYEGETMNAYGGFSVYHINSPVQTVMDDPNSRIPWRFTVHGGSNFLLGEVMRLTVHGLFQQQQKISEVSVGGAFGYDLNETSSVYLGAWYRFNEAVCPYFSIVFGSIQAGLSFDLLTSSLKQATPKNGSIELSFIFVKPDNSFEKKAMPWYY